MKRILKRTLGILLLASPFLVMLAGLFYEHGLRGILIMAGAVVLGGLILYLGVKLISD